MVINEPCHRTNRERVFMFVASLPVGVEYDTYALTQMFNATRSKRARISAREFIMTAKNWLDLASSSHNRACVWVRKEVLHYF